MKKVINMLLLSVLSLPLFTACETDTESNPTLNEPTSFVLNVPSYATNNVYDLKNSKTLEITCSQPDYGVPMATTYSVQVSLDAEFAEKTDESAANYVELGTTYTTAKMAVDASEVNSAILQLWDAKHEGVDFPAEPMKVYIRLRALITDSNRGAAMSNIIELPKVLGAPIDILPIPKSIFLNGSMLESGVWKPMVAISGRPGEFWLMQYFDKDAAFKFGTKEKEYIGYNYANLTIKDEAEAGIEGIDGANGGKDIKVANAGWYILYIKATVDKKENQYVFSMKFFPAALYLCGETTGGEWGYPEAWKFTTPEGKDGDFVSPAMKTSGEARITARFAEVPDGDWWKAELTLLKGTTIFYRENNNIPDNWKKNMGDDYSITGASGKTIHLNFTKGTGSLK